MPKPTIRALPLALVAALGLAPLAGAQTDADATATEEAADGGTAMSGPKRVRAPEAVSAEAETGMGAEATEDDAAAGEGSDTAQAEATAEDPQQPQDAGPGPFVGDYTIGDPNAPVQVIEYASFTCPHCADFHVESWPDLKEDFVDTGKIGFTLREVYFDRFGLWASMTARCGGEKAFYPMADLLLKKQSEWTSVATDDIGKAIARIGRLSGLSDEQLKACLENEEFATLLVEAYQANAAEDEVRSTPTFIVRGPDGEERVVGNSPEELRTAVEAAMGAS